MVTRRQFALGGGCALLSGLTGRSEAASAATIASEPLGRELARLEGELEGRLGVAILDTATGERASHRGEERFPMCSTFKALACGAVLQRVDAGHEDLHRRIRFEAEDVVTYSPVTKAHAGGEGMTLAEICEAGLTQSDNTAANLILASLGGPAQVTAFARRIGDGVTRLDRTETSLNEATPGDPRDTTTPDAMAADLKALLLGDVLSQPSREQLTAWLLANRTGDAKLRAGVPKDWRVGDKTGGGGFGTTNDIAILWPPGRKPLIACVYITQTKASFDACNATIASVGRALDAALRS
jgi:beta-lactamase class A